MMTILEL